MKNKIPTYTLLILFCFPVFQSCKLLKKKKKCDCPEWSSYNNDQNMSHQIAVINEK